MTHSDSTQDVVTGAVNRAGEGYVRQRQTDEATRGNTSVVGVAGRRWGGGLLLLLFISCCDCCPRCPPPPARCRFKDTLTQGECLYAIDGAEKDLVIDSKEDYFGIKCPPGVGLDSRSLPRLDADGGGVVSVVTTQCGAPRGTYGAALARLGVNLGTLERLRVTKLPPCDLTPQHFESLPALRVLELQTADVRHPARGDAELLSSLPTLEEVYLFGVKLPDTAEQDLGNVTVLVVRYAGWTEPRLAGRRLKRLVLVDSSLAAPPAPASLPALRDLTLGAPRARGPDVSSLHNLTLEGMENVELTGDCGSLERLTVRGVSAPRALPAGWLARCPSLASLTVVVRSISSLPATLLTGAVTLTRLKLSHSRRLTALPSGLFRDNTRLEYLDLSYNGLTSLPSGIFAKLTNLEELDLRGNFLTAASLGPLGAGALAGGAGGGGLRRLALDGNLLGDLCPPAGTIVTTRQLSPLHSLRSLQQLGVSRTGARSLCLDWRTRLTHLTHIDLTTNNITDLEWSDLQWERAANETARVELSENPIRGVWVTPRQYLAAEPGPVTVELILGESPLQCDCRVFWLVRALRAGRLRAALPGARCVRPASDPHHPRDQRPLLLQTVNDTALVCPEEKGCPQNCSCVYRPADDTLVARCEGRGLTHLPLPPARTGAATPRLELLVAHNNISHLPALPIHLAALDLSNNSLITPGTGLLSMGRRVWLAHNPLHCVCPSTLLDEIRLHPQQVEDLDEAMCSDGTALRTLVARGCGAGGDWRLQTAAIAGAVGGALILALLLLVLTSRRSRLWVRRELVRRGLCLRWAAPDDDDDQYKYDVFLSFSHEDLEVATTIQRELEGGAGGSPLRLCIHHRDWTVGDFIPKQIAESVRTSRRTVVLLSEAFVKSGWARAEFREAVAQTARSGGEMTRLVVVLLEGAPPPGLDEELLHYVTNNTWARWGEPAFFDKLRKALPTPRTNTHTKTQDHKENKKKEKKKKHAPATPAPAPPSPPAPPTPVVKFSHIDFPEPVKPVKRITSPCA